MLKGDLVGSKRFQPKLTLLARQLGRSWVTYNREHLLKKALERLIGTQVIDVGCADGGFIPLLSSSLDASLAIGVDLSLSELSIAKRYNDSANSEYFCADANALPFRISTFDLIFCKDLLHHLYDPVGALHEFKRILKRNGIIVIVETERNNQLMKMYIKYGHNHFMLTQLLVLVEKAGLKITKIKAISAYPHHWLFWSGEPIEILWNILTLIFLSICHIFTSTRAYFLKLLSAIMKPSYNIIFCCHNENKER